MRPWRAVALVAGRELVARRKAVALVVAITVVLVVAGLQLVGLGSGDSPAALPADEADELVGFLGTMVLFMAIIFTGQVILLGVAEEKNSRVVEVVLGAIRARELLTGKILAIGFLGLIEVAVAVATVLVVGSAMNTVQIPDATAGAAGAVLLWFVLGFAFYATVYAAAGALVSRTENAANAAVPINLALVVGYLIATSSVGSPDNPLVQWVSLLPPLAPLTMPLRMVDGSVAAWEVALAAALTMATALGLVRLAGRVYAGGIMQTARVGWRKALRAG